jgi:DNA helicase-2/ATP-dependent DNA helicase PcrA
MSLHKSKGLSSPVVIIAGCVEGLLPTAPEIDASPAERQAAVEEQRRLFFVGLTRVKAMPGDNRPGVLVLTPSRSMSLADAMQTGIRPANVRYGRAIVHKPIHKRIRSCGSRPRGRIIIDLRPSHPGQLLDATSVS